MIAEKEFCRICGLIFGGQIVINIKERNHRRSMSTGIPNLTPNDHLCVNSKHSAAR